MIEPEANFRAAAVLRVAEEMALAARTAPKGRGLDLLEIVVLAGDDIQRLSAKMQAIGEREKHQTFLRDSENVKSAQAIVVIGTKTESRWVALLFILRLSRLRRSGTSESGLRFEQR
jgi:uncharacterized ferredoxin-like protein